MKTTFQEINNARHLPYVMCLDQITPEDVFAFGTGTFKYLPRDEAQHIQVHMDFMARYAQRIGVQAENLQWIMRVEGGKQANDYASGYGKVRRHNHFILLKEGLENDGEIKLNDVSLLSRLKKSWTWGWREVERYDSANEGWSGIGYLLKAPLGMRSEDYGDQCSFSPAIWSRTMKKHLKERVA